MNTPHKLQEILVDAALGFAKETDNRIDYYRAVGAMLLRPNGYRDRMMMSQAAEAAKLAGEVLARQAPIKILYFKENEQLTGTVRAVGVAQDTGGLTLTIQQSPQHEPEIIAIDQLYGVVPPSGQ